VQLTRWQRFAVLLKGDAEPIVVQVVARDWATVTMDPAAGLAAMGLTFQVVHNALLREGVDVPRDYDGFLDVLDAMPEAIDDADPNALDPTPAGRSDGPP
jgi:hypothetical protein